MAKPTIVLVHGAWADGSSWNAVATELQRDGFTVLTPPNLLRGVPIDSPYIASFLAQRTSGPVVLVGHSYGGFVITNAGFRRGRRQGVGVRRRVHPRRGRDRLPDPRWVRLGPRRARPDHGARPRGYPGAPEGDVEAFLKPDTVHDSFAQDLPEADRWLIVASQRPIALSANTTPSGAAAWKSLPSWAVVGTEDRVIPPDTQRSMAERAGATITEVAGSHVSMVSNPQVTHRCDHGRSGCRRLEPAAAWQAAAPWQCSSARSALGIAGGTWRIGRFLSSAGSCTVS